MTNPRLAAALLGTLIKGMGADHVLWGTDSVWYGSPQWQIEAFRRLEIPEDMQKNNQFAPLGAADGPVKRAILGGNSARLYRVDVKSAQNGSPRTRSPRSRRSTSPWVVSVPTRATATSRPRAG